MANKKQKMSFKMLLVVILLIATVFLLGFKLNENKTPNEYYAIYLDGKKIGTVKSKEEFNKYINIQEEKLKQQYNVDKIYTPKGVEIKKVITYSNNTNSNEEIYKILTETENFTIKGVVIEITKEASEENTMPDKTFINLLNKEMFDEAIVDIIKAFIDDEEYNAFMTSTQKEITDTAGNGSHRRSAGNWLRRHRTHTRRTFCSRIHRCRRCKPAPYG